MRPLEKCDNSYNCVSPHNTFQAILLYNHSKVPTGCRQLASLSHLSAKFDQSLRRQLTCEFQIRQHKSTT